MSLTPLPAPPADTDGVVDWVSRHLGDLASGDSTPSPTRGGQAAADAALDGFDVTGYARRRNSVLPLSARGASRLSPYIRHGLLTLPRVYEHVKSGPASDVRSSVTNCCGRNTRVTCTRAWVQRPGRHFVSPSETSTRRGRIRGTSRLRVCRSLGASSWTPVT